MVTSERDAHSRLKVEAPAGYWQREVSHYPKPLTPLGASTILEGINQAFPKVFAEFGLLLDRFEFREIGGYVYTSAKPFGVPEPRDGAQMPPAPMLWLALRLVPSLRRRIARCKRAVRDGLDVMLLDRWYDEWRLRLVDDIALWRAVDLASLSDRALAEHFHDLRTWLFDACDIHFYLAAAVGLPLARLSFFCRDHLRYGDARVFELLAGLSGASSEPALALGRLAARIAESDDLRTAILACPSRDLSSVLKSKRPDLSEELDAYMEHYGFRALRYEVAEKSLNEQPELVAQLLQDQLRSRADVAGEQQRLSRRRDEARSSALSALVDGSQREEFLRLLAVAERAYPVREDNEFYTTSVPLALLRNAALEAGARLVRRASIAAIHDAFFLRFDELLSALRGDSAAAPTLVHERRRQHASAASFDPPVSYGEPSPEPPLSILPPESRLAMEAMIYMRDKVFELEESSQRAAIGVRELNGRAAARGTYTGTARIILGEDEFDRLQPEDVLVCPITSPVWSILFAKVGALVTDSGGVLSHPAIIAREYGIPAVVATGNATQVIPDGCRVTVDGDTGVVRLLR